MRPGSTALRGPRRAEVSRRVLAVAGIVLLSGCSLLPSGEDPGTTEPGPTTSQQATPREGTLLDEGTTDVELSSGDTVQVSLPEGSLGVGDYWGVVSVDDPSIAEAEVAIGATVFGVEPTTEDPQNSGGTQQFSVEIQGLTAGETTVRVLYCTQTREVSEGCDQSRGTLETPVEPVEITVRVE